jgi:hypothetical protein
LAGHGVFSESRPCAWQMNRGSWLSDLRVVLRIKSMAQAAATAADDPGP